MDNIPNNFKLLAIRPLAGCNSKFTRKLKLGSLYKFIENYEFIQENGLILAIVANRDVDELYNQFNEGLNNVKINISAVVGENGSGKSSLVELLYLAVYIVAINQGLLTFDNDLYSQRERKEFEDICSKFKLELYYELDYKFYCIKFDPVENLTKNSNSNIHIIDGYSNDKLDDKILFYSIVVNYSLYGLNQQTSGYWLSKLFHKNDGYKTPIVINPYRDWGEIDIFSEAHLAQSRLLANLDPTNNDGVNILTDRSISSVNFRFIAEKTRKLDKHQLRNVIEKLKKNTQLDEIQIFTKIYTTILNTKDFPYDSKRIAYGTAIQNYVIKKIIKIARNYKQYRDLFYIEIGPEKIPSIQDINNYLDLLARDSSHVTLKLRQALNTYRFDMFKLPETEDGKSKQSITIAIKDLSERIAKAHYNFPEREIVEFIPTAILIPKIIMEDGSSFMTLSSGEQQFIHSMQSVIYHLNNLNSVFSTQDGRITFNHVNVILDEVELYFHPEFQRRYLFELLRNIRKLKIPNISAISITFLTHSPFILSDIPRVNILKLKEGKVVPQLDNTFAGNIHTMLADSFFMKSTMGEFAKKQYLNIIDFYNLVVKAKEDRYEDFIELYGNKRNLFYFILSNIGEDVIRGVLQNHLTDLDEKLGFDKQIFDPKINQLLRDRKQIDDELKKRGYDQN